MTAANPVYIGKIRWTPTGSIVCRHDFDDPDTMIVDGKHTAIVDQELWEAANRKIRRKSRLGQARRHDSEVTTHWLRGILRCSSCGTTLSFGKGSGNKSDSYRCNKYLNGACKVSQRITVPKIECAVLEVLLEDSRAFSSEDSANFGDKNEESPNDLKSIYDMLTSHDYSLTKKNSALKEIVLKVVYSKELDLLEFYYYCTE